MMNSVRWSLGACMVWCAVAVASESEDRLAAVFATAAVDAGDQSVVHEPTTRRARAIDTDLSLMDGAMERSIVRLNLFDDVDLRVEIDRLDERDLHRYTWTGRVLSEPGGTFVLVVEVDAIMGAVWLDDDRVFEVRSDATGQVWAVELDGAAFDPCATDHEHCIHSPREALDDELWQRGGTCADDGSIIDVMVVYTPAARSGAGGTNAIRALAESAVAVTNNAYANSQINARLRLVYLDEIEYTETGNLSTDLSRLRSSTDGHMDAIHAIRNSVRADMVALLTNTGSACGVAYLMTNLSTGFASSAFSVTRRSCAVGNLTFAHELGHNMGSAHDRDNAGSALFSYSYGSRWYSTNGTHNRSVMAYSPGTRRAHFSNPDVLFGGNPTGVPVGQPNPTDNARSINNAALTIANWRNGGTPPMMVLHPQGVEVQPGANILLVTAANGLGPIEYRWEHNGQPVVDDERISGATTPVLLIASATGGDAGVYRAIASNACGPTMSNAAVVTVLSEPCVVDLNGDGSLDFFDVNVFLGAFAEGDLSADFNGDGVLDFFDVSVFLAAFAAGCE